MVDPDSNIEKAIDLGFVGDPDKVDLTLLNQLIGHELIPVLAPLATSHEGQTPNVNADTFAGMHEAFRTGDLGHRDGGMKGVAAGDAVRHLKLVGAKADAVRAVGQ
jgi:hypothetical protein